MTVRLVSISVLYCRQEKGLEATLQVNQQSTPSRSECQVWWYNFQVGFIEVKSFFLCVLYRYRTTPLSLYLSIYLSIYLSTFAVSSRWTKSIRHQISSKLTCTCNLELSKLLLQGLPSNDKCHYINTLLVRIVHRAWTILACCHVTGAPAASSSATQT